MGGTPAWRLGVGLIFPHRKNKPVTKRFNELWTWPDSFDKRPKLRNMNMRFCT
jgi:hypothetical protein